MKYLYKNILAFFCIISFTVLLTGIIFVRFVVGNIYAEKEEQLYGYAESVIDANMTIQEVEAGMKMVSHQDVFLALYNNADRLVYPVADQNYSSGLGEKDLNRLKSGERLSLTERERGFTNEDMSMVTVYLPLYHVVSGDFTGFVAVASPVSGIQKEIQEIRRNILFTGIISAGIAILISIILANYMSRRIVRMQKATKEITQGNFEISLEDNHKDEFDDLSRDFNLMVQSLKDSQEEIERQEHLRRQFMMDVAHELRTPLTTMNGVLEGLAHDMIPEKSRERSVTLMHKETKRMIRMVNENLDYEKIRSEQIALVKQELQAYDVLETIKLQLQQKAKVKGNEIILNVPKPLTIYADYDRFIQIIFNLTNNAIQFTDDGQITLSAWEEDDYSVIAVKDTGIGIDKEEITSIWERFYKVDISRKNNRFGESGIGLAIVHSLVKNHDGRIDVASEPGVGTTFTIYLPKKKTATP